MRNKPGNLVLAILAACMLLDVFIARPSVDGGYLITIGVFGALLSRALLDEAQSIMAVMLGSFLTMYALFRNHGIIDRPSDGWFAVALVIALLYAFWEKILNWLSL